MAKDVICPKNTCAVVVDDSTGITYLYGNNIVHENYHVPSTEGGCTFTGVLSSEFFPKTVDADEYFDGVQPDNKVTLAHKPMVGTRVLVFMNGLKQRKGSSYDYTIDGKVITFTTEIKADDSIEVIYEYGVE